MSSDKSDGRQSQPDARCSWETPPQPTFSVPDRKDIKDDGQTGFRSFDQIRPKIHVTEKMFKSKEYVMNHSKTGKAIVINNQYFRKKSRSDSDKRKIREHTDRDRDAIVKVLQQLGFEGINYKDRQTKRIDNKMVFEDVQKEDLLRLLKDAGDDHINDYSDMDCFICVILSYGEPGVVYCPGGKGKQHDDPVELKKLIEPLKGDRCQGLILKPKLFFIQGCPYIEQDEADDSSEKVKLGVTKKVPIEADFLTQSCHLPASYGWICKEDGTSWYIRALCEALDKYCIQAMNTSQRSLHFLKVLTRVNRLVAELMTKEGNMTPDRTYQIPLVTSLLTKHMYFYPKKVAL